MNKLDAQYFELLKDILDNGRVKGDRTGTGTISLFGKMIRHNMTDGFPILTSKKVSFKSVWVELLWFLRGETNIKFLVDNNVTIWNGDAYKHYKKYVNEEECCPECAEGYGNEEAWKELEHCALCKTPKDILTPQAFNDRIKEEDNVPGSFTHRWGELGPVYGSQWRNFGKPDSVSQSGFDQIRDIVSKLKTNPNDRRMLVSAWNPTDLDEMVLPPCHYVFQCYTRELTREERYKWCLEKAEGWAKLLTYEELVEKLRAPEYAVSLMWNQRSVDTPLGLPFNIASYGLLLTLIAKEVNMIPDELIGVLGDTHIYLNQVEGIKEQLNSETFDLPLVSDIEIAEGKSIVEEVNMYEVQDIKLNNYKSSKAIKMPLSN